MERTVEEIIASVNVNEPYVWRLHITAEEYKALENHALILGTIANKNEAMEIIVFLAEWYKRNYKSGNESPIDTDTARKAWEMSGINTDKYVYTTESGSHLWQYSIFVLGGLAINHELVRNDKGKFLKALCRIYHGEDYTLENLDDANRAIAFRKSIALKHSLYEYLKAILTGDYTDNDEQSQTLLLKIKTANDEILRSKFRLEWIVKLYPQATCLERRLRVWLKPEEVGGGLHQYLGYDRMRLWGIAEPTTINDIFVGLRWKNGERIVEDLDKQHPLARFSNTNSDNGFVAWGIDRYAACKDIPNERFTRIQIVAFDMDGNEYVTSEEQSQDWMQLWQTELGGYEWSSRQSAQHKTAVIYADNWDADRDADLHLPFRSKGKIDSKPWNWNYIHDHITIASANNRITFYNRIGYDQVFTRLYDNTIRYIEGGLVAHRYIDDPDESDELETEHLPLIFGKDNVMVRHFATKDAIREADVESERHPELIEYKVGDRYIMWNEDSAPKYGVLTLRITNRQQQFKLKAIYLPSISADQPIVRDFATQSIVYKSMDGSTKREEDKVEFGDKPIHPVVFIYIGNNDDFTEIEVFHPTLKKEIVVDGKVARVIDDGETLVMPYILKDRTRLSDFNRDGYKVYDCKELSSIYATLDDLSNAHIAAWQDGYSVRAGILDENAPQWLMVSLGDNRHDGRQGMAFYYWDYEAGTYPMPVGYDCAVKKGSVVFQDMRKVDCELSCVFPKICNGGAWGMKGRNISELHCFEIAVEYRLYFFIFEPLRLKNINRLKERVYYPLLEKRQGTLNDEDIANLKRLCEENGFNWKSIQEEK